jgi:hypothetical protein
MKTKLTASHLFPSLQDHLVILPVLRNSPEISRKKNSHQEWSVGQLLPPHVSDTIFFCKRRRKTKITFFLSFSMSRSTKHGNSHSFPALKCTLSKCSVRHRKPCSSDPVSSNLVSFSKKTDKTTPVPPRRRGSRGRNDQIKKTH